MSKRIKTALKTSSYARSLANFALLAIAVIAVAFIVTSVNQQDEIRRMDSNAKVRTSEVDNGISKIEEDISLLNDTLESTQNSIDTVNDTLGITQDDVAIIEEGLSLLNDTVQEFVPCSVSTCDALLQETQDLIYTPGTVAAYISSTGTANEECSESMPCTLNAAIDYLNKRKADTAVIQFHPESDEIYVGLFPETNLFPTVSQYNEIRIQGDKKDFRGFGTASGVGSWGPRDQWARIDFPPGTFEEGLYDTFFAYNRNRDLNQVVYNTTADSIFLISRRASEFTSDDRQFWTSNSTFSWRGTWDLGIPFGSITFDSVIFRPFFNANLRIPSTQEHRAMFRNCHMGCHSRGSSYVGSFKSFGCYAPVIGDNPIFSDGSRAQCLPMRSNWLDNVPLTVRGSCDFSDIFIERDRLSILNGVSTVERFLVTDAGDRTLRIAEATSVSLKNGVVEHNPTPGSLGAMTIKGASQVLMAGMDIIMDPTNRRFALRVDTSSQVMIAGGLKITGAGWPMWIEETSQVTIQAQVVLEDYTEVGVRVEAGSTLMLWMEGTASFTWTERTVDAIELDTGSTLVFKSLGDVSTRFLFNTTSPAYFLRVNRASKVSSLFAGAFAPVNQGPGPLLFFCGNGNSPWVAQSDFGAPSPQFCIFDV